MPDKTKIITTSSAQTRLIKNGMVYIQPTIIKKPLKPLFVLFAYAGENGAKEMLNAARFKEKRLRKRYPNANVRIINTFKYPSHFKAEWTKLYKYLTKSEIANEYSLWEVHYFGHGGPESLYLEKEGGRNGANSEIFFNDSDNMERLPWDPGKGIFVLHSCRGAAYEDTFIKEKVDNKICLANTISVKQSTRCLGQICYASFCPEPLFDLSNTAEEEAKRFGYRPNAAKSKLLLERFSVNRVLWGYAITTGKTGLDIVNNHNRYLQCINKPYPIAHYVDVLSPENQIMPCRIFKNGTLVHKPIVVLNYFNKEDLEYL